MVRAAMSSWSNTQSDCQIWLESYFEKYGDIAPNKDETRLLLMQKKVLYEKYVDEFTASTKTAPRPVVLESKFYEMWANLFPKCVKRPWCDIPGKCDTCYEIDKFRRTEEDPEAQRFLKEAHVLHRGGLFKLERDTYVNFLRRAIMIFVLDIQEDAKKQLIVNNRERTT